MSLNECLLGNEFFEQKGIMALSDTPSANGMTAAELKAAFDDLSKNYVGKNFNKLINMLTELGVESLIQSGDIGYVRLNADGMLEVSADGNVWTLAASGGHIIVDKDGKTWTQRSRLKFAGETEVTDDGTQTVISGLRGDKGEQGEQGVQGLKAIRVIKASAVWSLYQMWRRMVSYPGKSKTQPMSRRR